MPTNKDIASEIWLHLNSPESLDKVVGNTISKLQREERLDELSDYQNERKEIDDTVERYMGSPVFENHRQKFVDIDDKHSPELEKAVAEMAYELKHNDMTPEDREAAANELSKDFESLKQAVNHDLSRDEVEPEY